MCQDDDVRTEMSCDSNITFGVDCLIDCVRNLLIQLVVDPFRFVILQRIAFQLCQCQVCASEFVLLLVLFQICFRETLENVLKTGLWSI
jgi:hypothetical protein